MAQLSRRNENSCQSCPDFFSPVMVVVQLPRSFTRAPCAAMLVLFRPDFLHMVSLMYENKPPQALFLLWVFACLSSHRYNCTATKLYSSQGILLHRLPKPSVLVVPRQPDATKPGIKKADAFLNTKHQRTSHARFSIDILQRSRYNVFVKGTEHVCDA